MSAWLVAACGLAYLYVSLDMAYKGQWAISVMYFGYAFANVGAYIIAQKGLH